MQHYSGMDAHNNLSVFQHMDEEGAIGLHMRVETSEKGFNKFLETLDTPTSITLEAGRNYWWIQEFLSSHPMVTDVNVVDPRRSRIIAEELSVISGYGRAKNDDIDSEMLADLTRRGLAPTINIPSPEQLEQRTMCRARSLITVDNTRTKNRIHGLLAFYGMKATINDLLSNSKEIMVQLPSYIKLIVEQNLTKIRLYEKQIISFDTELEILLPGSHPQIKLLLTVPGIGIVLARIILTEILDIKYFKEPKYVISYSGLAPFDNDSAGRKGKIKLNRHCNYHLKYAFVEAAHNARKTQNYKRKYELDLKKHSKMIAKLNLARRIAKTVYWILTRQQPYNK